MRKFSDFEKDILQQMLANKVFVNNSEQNNMQKLIKKYIQDVFKQDNILLSFESSNDGYGGTPTSLLCKYSEIKFINRLNQQAPNWHKNSSDHCKKRAKEELILFRLFIVKLLIMFEELQAENFIYLISTDNDSLLDIKLEKTEEAFDCVETRPIDIGSKLLDKYYQFFNKQIILSSKIYNLLESKFKTDEEIRHQEVLQQMQDELGESKDQFKRQLRATWTIAIFSILATITSIIFYSLIYFRPIDKVISNEKTTKELTKSIDKLTKSQYEILTTINRPPDKPVLK